MKRRKEGKLGIRLLTAFLSLALLVTMTPCKVYVYAQNGAVKALTVKVK